MFRKFRALNNFIVERRIVANQPNILFQATLHPTHDKALLNLQYVDAVGLNAFDAWIVDNDVPLSDKGRHIAIADLQHFDVVRQTQTAQGLRQGMPGVPANTVLRVQINADVAFVTEWHIMLMIADHQLLDRCTQDIGDFRQARHFGNPVAF